MSEPARLPVPVEGGCLCGAVRYAVSSEPERVTICYCRFCQRATGSTHMIEPIIPQGAFAVTRGAPATYVHISEGSGKPITLSFCSSCGTKTHMAIGRFPGVVGVYAGSLDEPGWANAFPDRTWRIFTHFAASGTVIPAGVRTWPEHRLANDGEPRDPVIYDTPFVTP